MNFYSIYSGGDEGSGSEKEEKSVDNNSFEGNNEADGGRKSTKAEKAQKMITKSK